MTHSPFPWIVVDRDTWGNVPCATVQSRDHSNNGSIVAACPGPDGDDNARLISGILDLVKALQLAIYWGRRSGPIPSERLLYKADREMIDAAVAQFLGEAPPIENRPATASLVIEIDGGLVQNVEINGEYVSAEVHDYDTEGADESEIETDDEGGKYVLRHS